MLIIAQPKSASTSLATTLGEIIKVPWHQLEFAKNNVGRPAYLGPSSTKRKRVFSALPHSDIIEYTKKEITGMSSHKDIFKQHIPPTKNNLELITTIRNPYLVLLRNPEDSVSAYKHVSKKIKLVKNEGDFNSKLKDMKAFYDGYMQVKDWKHVKVVHFEELILDTTNTINGILEFFDLHKLKEHKHVLSKKRFTGVGLKRLQDKKEQERQKELAFIAEQERIARNIEEITRKHKEEDKKRQEEVIPATEIDTAWWKRLWPFNKK